MKTFNKINFTNFQIYSNELSNKISRNIIFSLNSKINTYHSNKSFCNLIKYNNNTKLNQCKISNTFYGKNINYRNFSKNTRKKKIEREVETFDNDDKLKESDILEDIDKFELPLDKLSYHYSRSSGPGGQNVNKLNTKVEIRLNIEKANFLDDDVKESMVEMYKNRINKEGELYITCQDTRNQTKNKEICEQRMGDLIKEAMRPKNVSNFVKMKETALKKEFRIKEKKSRGNTKNFRNESRLINYF